MTRGRAPRFLEWVDQSCKPIQTFMLDRSNGPHAERQLAAPHVADRDEEGKEFALYVSAKTGEIARDQCAESSTTRAAREHRPSRIPVEVQEDRPCE